MNPGADSGFPPLSMAEARPGGFLSLLARGLCSSSQFGKCADALAPADKTAFIDGSLPSCVSAGHPFQNQKQGVPIVISQRPNRRQLQGCDLSGFGCDSILVTFSRPWRSKWWNNDNRSKFCFWCRRVIFSHMEAGAS